MPLAVNGMKQCCRCGETKPVSEYYKDKSISDGLQCHCKHCDAKKLKQWRAENPERVKEHLRKYYVENREDILEQKKQYRQEAIKTEPYVYIATDRSTGCFYIGETTTTIKERFRDHKRFSNTGLGKHISKHNLSLNDFEIEQHQCLSVEESTALERKLISENIDNPLCLNERRW